MTRPTVTTCALAIVTLIAVFVALATPARAIERTFAASAQIDYLAVPTAPNWDANGGVVNTMDGFTLEAALKVAVDISSHVSANVKVCYGCHGFEVDMAYFDLRVADELNFRLGRFSPSFGAFTLRHDPANQKLSDKPLPYDMGRMLWIRAFDYSILPSPMPDNGVEIDGTHWFGRSAQLDYAAYAVAGFRTNNTGSDPYDPIGKDGLPHAVDLDFAESRTATSYYIDNNSRPTGGGRLSLTVRTGPFTDLTLGASGMAGTYDDQNRLVYMILGGDASLRAGRTNIRAEYLVRRTEMDMTDPTLFKYGASSNLGSAFVKQGAYVEVEQPIVPDLDGVVRLDGMRRTGNVLASSAMTSDAWMGRETLGLAYSIERNLRLKLSGELYEYSGVYGTSARDFAFHVGVVGTF
jgi:hypothetical protein